MGAEAAHSACASQAASIAAWASSGVASAISHRLSPVAGSSTASVVAAGRIAPLAADEQLASASLRGSASPARWCSSNLHLDHDLQRIARPGGDRDSARLRLLKLLGGREMNLLKRRLPLAGRDRDARCAGARRTQPGRQGPRLRPRGRPVAVRGVRIRQARPRLSRDRRALLRAHKARPRLWLRSGSCSARARVPSSFSGRRPRAAASAWTPARATASRSSPVGSSCARRPAVACPPAARRARRPAG